jgi:hypothetical protein
MYLVSILPVIVLSMEDKMVGKNIHYLLSWNLQFPKENTT